MSQQTSSSNPKQVAQKLFRRTVATVFATALAAGTALPAFSAHNTPTVATQNMVTQTTQQTITTAVTQQAPTPAAIPATDVERLPEPEPEPEPVVTPDSTPAVANHADTQQPATNIPTDVASSNSITAAALAQLGAYQDCTDLVQNTFAALGLDTRRDQGGYDRGPWHRDYTQFGTTVTGTPQPGDILIWEGAHVAIALDNVMAVHGGAGPTGSNTEILPISYTHAGPTPTSIIRPH